MATTSKPVRSYDQVVFDFWNANLTLDLVGQVKIRNEELVIDIPRQKAQGPYLIIGKLNGQIFSGDNSSRDPDAPGVEAEWCKFSDQYAGVWIENGEEMLFGFRLPRKA